MSPSTESDTQDKNYTKQALLVIGVLVLGVVVFMFLVSTKPEPKKNTNAGAKAPVVDLVTARRVDHRVAIDATGTVQPSQSVSISTEVPGRVEAVSAQFVAGGRVAKGEPLIQLERERFELAVARAQSQLAQARTELSLEQGRGEVAQREWELFNRGDETQSPLALREPQRRAAQANVRAAEANLREAQLNLARATVTAPFGGVVQRESVDTGQYVQPSQALGELVGDDVFWVQTSVPQDRLAWMQLPDASGQGGTTATILMPNAPATTARTGRVVRLLGDLDPQSRRARLIVEVADPLAGENPLLIGSFVNVSLAGKTLTDVVEVPRDALLDDNTVWVMQPDNTIAKRTLEIVWRDTTTVYATSGIQESEQIILTRLPLAVAGMTVTPKGASPAAQPGAGAGDE